MRILPTALGAKGALFFGTVLMLFLATPYSNLFFLLTAFLLVLGAMGVLGAWNNVRGLECEVLQLAMAPAGSHHELVVRLSAPSARQRFGVAVDLEIDGRRQPAARAAIARAGGRFAGRLEGMARGLHRVDAICISSRHPFGVCRAVRRQPVRGIEIVAYPPPAALGAHGAPGGLAGVGAAAHHSAGPDAVAGLRAWRPGDPLRDVHWKATARRGEPVVKERDATAGEGLEVVLDRRAAGDELETALQILSALLLRAAEEKQPLRVRSQGYEAVHGPGHRTVGEGLRWLAAVRPLPAGAAPPAGGSPTALHLPLRRTAEARHV